MTIKQILQLEKTKIDKFDPELLLAFALKKPREFIVAHPEYKLSFFEYLKFRNFLKKRKKGIPLAYITGHKNFFGLDFLVNKHTLVPRPDTEILVENVLEKIPAFALSGYGRAKKINLMLIDIGTGSGCIPIAILSTIKHQPETGQSMAEKNIKCFATDISKPALKIAKKNAKKQNVNINFLHGDLLTPLLKKPSVKFQTPIIITANLPYLTHEQFTNEPSIQHEPYSALVAEDNGLALYKKLLEQIKILDANFPISLFLEIDPSQSHPLTEYIKTIFPNAKIEIKKDYSGFDRILNCEIDT